MVPLPRQEPRPYFRLIVSATFVPAARLRPFGGVRSARYARRQVIFLRPTVQRLGVRKREGAGAARLSRTAVTALRRVASRARTVIRPAVDFGKRRTTMRVRRVVNTRW